ncbi:carbon-nitrogen hydrolase [Sphaerosporella brunnea]|uniref:Carbon-nitrogen hydrolase n=1 Tax=Sphaerosporella brunnea TaxID=1250544 RepID=A0A5J5FC04_9PEZI|nr:carbon-nitrogen hydrolase [Sphaerosporella brunnea]
MPLTIGVAQYPTQSSLPRTLQLLTNLTRKSAADGINLLVFPEAFLGGYPRTSYFGATVGGRTAEGRDEFYEYWKQAVDLGDVSPEGLGEYVGPGDGTRQKLEEIARETGVFLVVGCVEKSGGTLWCAVLFVDPVRGLVGKRRKVMPTGTERVVWGVGSPKTLKAIDAVIGGEKVVLGAAICWENYMPLLRTSLYSQGVTIYLAPTADARESWVSTMQHIALESRAFVVGCNQFVTTDSLPAYVPASTARGEMEMEDEDTPLEDVAVEGEVVSNGGSVIFDPLGRPLAGPLWGGTGVLKATIESVEREVVRAKMDMDTAFGGHYSRSDVFKLSVEGLDLKRIR